MNELEKGSTVESYAVTDRGLNERRPLNEDSFLNDSQHSIFSVADGVGGAEAGEVASKTAIEVLDEAFRHQVEGGDIEDLMELAIQRANASIHQMAQDNAKFAMMATTIVALHLKGNVATIGHVGDSRLYRLTPEGRLLRETEDHSVVEEEVRAGRMTAEQAANHPSKNVISRALGAENTVEVDLKTIEIANGTEFLLCTDGITRHISDAELNRLLVEYGDLAALCAELKRRCYESGAEDNLTAVVVRFGAVIPAGQRINESQLALPAEAKTRSAAVGDSQTFYGNLDLTEDALVPPSRLAFPATVAQEAELISTPERRLNIPDSSPSGGSSLGRTLVSLFIFLLLVAVGAGAFYAGRRYKGPVPFLTESNEVIPQVSPSPIVAEDPLLRFERARREIDRDPAGWMGNPMKLELAGKGILNPLESPDPEFLYLYGRASLLTGNTDEAAKAFAQAIDKARLSALTTGSTVQKEATLALAALALKSDKEKPRALTHFDEMLQKPANSNSP
ncbi:MAG: PP2C family protein-serine/threonine phosphatase [Pyrinomonadaceae bacterium]